MKYNFEEPITKISVSDMSVSLAFYTKILGFKVEKKYSINVSDKYAADSYEQLSLRISKGCKFKIGLFVDLDSPLNPKPTTGTVPSFIVSNLEKALKSLQAKKVSIDHTDDGKFIQVNKSDKGYVDRFFFFRDPDNNSLVMRQNMGKTKN